MGPFFGLVFDPSLLFFVKATPKQSPYFGPRFGPAKNGVSQTPNSCFFGPTPQANAAWQWFHALRSTFQNTGKQLLLVNMDETSVAAFHGSQLGNVMRCNEGEEEPIQWATRGTRRTCFTHSAFICNNARIQKKLPQLLLVNEHTITIPQYNRLLERRPWNVYIKRVKSAWMNEELTAILVGVLKEHLKDELAQFDIMLFLDAARIHCARRVILACNHHGIRLLLVPAQLTWLLQPCDTHLFVNYKHYMRRRWQEIAITMANGVVDIETLFDIVFDTIETIVN